MVLCCCWPIHKCVQALSCLDTLVIAIFAYKSFDDFLSTSGDPHWTTIAAVLFFSAFFVCQLLGTVFIHLAHTKNIARYCLPRLVLICGLVVCSLILNIIMIVYFTGGSKAMNGFFFKAYEYFFDEQLSEVNKVELKYEIRNYAIVFFLLTVTFMIYSIFELYLTKKFKDTLRDFQAVPTEASAPQMSYNPEFAEPPKKVYPNIA